MKSINAKLLRVFVFLGFAVIGGFLALFTTQSNQEKMTAHADNIPAGSVVVNGILTDGCADGGDGDACNGC
jgi:hypothetical protein